MSLPTIFKRYRLFLYYWMPVIIYCVMIFVQSSFPSPVDLSDFSHSDKIAHFFGYALLGALIFRAYKATFDSKYAKMLIIFSLLTAMVYAASDEWHQSFVESREGDVLDFWADTLGAFSGIFIYKRVSAMAFFKERRRRTG